ncbi:dipeptidase [Clostridium sp. AM58-1XD]|uniref:dipeptidase n=1 Tax=Clostridium sp. AM58-1XD TaxID=2292307 RepID=UPI000E467346|nr:dipeptidase [Clostridium sp. AM58-1XD]RGY99459.1 membrane dipeptidase [Clostridium sp. AM58-1XD]
MKVADMHCDTILEIQKDHKNGGNISLLDSPLQINLERLEKGDYLVQNFGMFVHLGREKQPFRFCMELIDVFYQEMELFADRIGVATSFDDIEKNRRQGKISALLTIEEGAACEGEVFLLRDLYRMGARMMTLTWNFENCLGFPNRKITEGPQAGRYVPDTERGLTDKGIVIVEEMERIGMIPDISHLSDAGIWDVFRHTKKPFVASHSNARALASHPRNLTDEMIKALSDRGGVMGINYYSAFLRDWKEKEEEKSRISDMIRHMKYIKNIGGIECIGLGSDFDGIDGQLEIDGPDKLPLLEHEMRKAGFTEREIEAVFCKNVLRLYRDVL